MSTSLDGLELILRSVLSTKPWLRDPAVVPIPFRQDVYEEYISRDKAPKTPLKLGVFWTNGVVEPHPPISRALRLVAEAVKSAGHKVSGYLLLCRCEYLWTDLLGYGLESSISSGG
jgi:amidase